MPSSRTFPSLSCSPEIPSSLLLNYLSGLAPPPLNFLRSTHRFGGRGILLYLLSQTGILRPLQISDCTTVRAHVSRKLLFYSLIVLTMRRYILVSNLDFFYKTLIHWFLPYPQVLQRIYLWQTFKYWDSMIKPPINLLFFRLNISVFLTFPIGFHLKAIHHPCYFSLHPFQFLSILLVWWQSKLDIVLQESSDQYSVEWNCLFLRLSIIVCWYCPWL